jgi:hypothetical protein
LDFKNIFAEKITLGVTHFLGGGGMSKTMVLKNNGNLFSHKILVLFQAKGKNPFSF